MKETKFCVEGVITNSGISVKTTLPDSSERSETLIRASERREVKGMKKGEREEVERD